MADDDIDAAVDLLRAGFPERSARYWHRALERLRTRTMPDGLPRYGYVMADHGRLVGIIMLIISVTDSGKVRGNVSSWYVDPAYRSFSHMLLSAPLRLKDVALFNISPASKTFETIEAQGFSRYVDGTFVALAAAAPPVFGARVRRVEAHTPKSAPVLTDHAAWGCLSFEVVHEGTMHPFVFVPRRVLRGLVPCAQLAFCHDVEDFVRFAGPLGRRLLRHGLCAVLVDANGPLEGLPGTFRRGRSPKFSTGVTPPRLGDLSYTELTMFGA